MTIVAKITLEETSILIGDSLISGVGLNKEIFVPTIGSIYEAIPKDPELNVRELHKKINIIGNNIIIGLYGNALAA